MMHRTSGVYNDSSIHKYYINSQYSSIILLSSVIPPLLATTLLLCDVILPEIINTVQCVKIIKF